MRESRK